MSAERSARTVSATEQVDKVRALQRVLYRSAKQEPHRRFHALYDKVARSDDLGRSVAPTAGDPERGGPGLSAVLLGRPGAEVADAGAGLGVVVDPDDMHSRGSERRSHPVDQMLVKALVRKRDGGEVAGRDGNQRLDQGTTHMAVNLIGVEGLSEPIRRRSR